MKVEELRYEESHGGAALVARYGFPNGYGVSVLRLTDEYRRKNGYEAATRYEVAVLHLGDLVVYDERLTDRGVPALSMDMSAEDANKVLAKVEAFA